MSKVSSFPPVYDHEPQKASENLRQALPFINKHKTPANPVNYAVWYEYVSGDNKELTDAIDIRLQKNQPITADVTQYLFEKYVLMDMPERIEKTNTGMRLIVDNTIDNIHKAENTAGRCASGLNDTQSVLEGCDDINELKGLVSEILSHTKTLASTSNDLKQELAQSTEAMLELKSELEAVKKAARTDGLTGLLNRGAFNNELAELCHQPQGKAVLALFDLDHFKRLNDTFGHLVGDKVLQFFSGILQKHCDDIHIAARYGGEEMAMILMYTSRDESIEIAEKIRAALSSSNLKKKGSEESIGQITVSVGLSALAPDDTPTSLIDRADKALYSSKENGRNQVTFN